MFSKPISKKLIIILSGIILGGIGGYVYYIKIGCVSGTCPLTSNPYLTILWGMVFGYLIADIIGGKKKAKQNDTTE